MTVIDTSFDFRTDATTDDPDQSSPTLRRYHRLLWSKPLPNGEAFDLVETTPHVYLHHRSHLGEFFLASDSVIPAFTRYVKFRHITDQLTAEQQEAFNTIGYTIGGMMIFPANKIGNKLTINGARGFYGTISDRMDLTLECIRRHYEGEAGGTPLEKCLSATPTSSPCSPTSVATSITSCFTIWSATTASASSSSCPSMTSPPRQSRLTSRRMRSTGGAALTSSVRGTLGFTLGR